MPSEQTEERRKPGSSGRRTVDDTIKALAMELTELQTSVKQLEEDNKTLREQLLEDIRAIRSQSETQLEIMQAWSNAKGFVRTIQMLGRVATWLLKIAAVLTGLWAAVKYGKVQLPW